MCRLMNHIIWARMTLDIFIGINMTYFVNVSKYDGTDYTRPIIQPS